VRERRVAAAADSATAADTTTASRTAVADLDKLSGTRGETSTDRADSSEALGMPLSSDATCA
jgi:hypothetical protein